MDLSLVRHIRPVAQIVVSVCLATGVLTSTLALSRSANSAQAMSCCAAGSTHCNSGMMSAANAAPPEPMCGVTPVVVSDEDTIIAEPDPPGEVGSTPAITAPCATDCCSFALSFFKRPKRDHVDRTASIVRAQIFDLHAAPRIPGIKLFLSSRFDRTTPRGPPLS